MKSPVLFLDRDGTVNVDCGPKYLNEPSQARLIPGVGRALIKARNQGFKIALITNQAGVAKGITPKENLPLIHRRLEELIASEGGAKDFRFDDIRVCMHHPNDACNCRKPEIRMLEESIQSLDANIERSVFVGDKLSDLLCASRVGMQSILVLTGHGVQTQAELKEQEATATLEKFAGVASSLSEAVEMAVAGLA